MRDFRLYLDDIIESIRKIQTYTEGVSRSDYSADEKTQDAVLRNLEIIGEAAGKLPDELTAKVPAIEWSKIKALRNILIHEYFGIDDSIVWDVVQNKLTSLKIACLQLLQED